MEPGEPALDGEGVVPSRTRGPLLLVGVALVLVVAATVALGSNPPTPAVASAAPSAVLDAALAEGKPTYILIHSLT